MILIFPRHCPRRVCGLCCECTHNLFKKHIGRPTVCLFSWLLAFLCVCNLGEWEVSAPRPILRR